MVGQESTLQIRVQATGYKSHEHRFTLRVDTPWPDLELALEPCEANQPDEPERTEGQLPDDLKGPGLISWWWPAPIKEGPNCPVCRGVAVTPGGHYDLPSPVDADGRFSLAGPWHKYPLCLQRSGSPPMWLRPVKAGHSSHRVVPCGSISGRIVGIPFHAALHVHVVLFSNGLVRMAVRVRADGTFELKGVPARKWWLRAGDDAFHRVMHSRGAQLGLQDFSASAKPWIDAIEVDVPADGIAEGIELTLG